MQNNREQRNLHKVIKLIVSFVVAAIAAIVAGTTRYSYFIEHPEEPFPAGSAAAISAMLAFVIAFLITWLLISIIMAFIKRTTSWETEGEKEAVQKGIIAYLLTDSILFGWLVAKKYEPKDRL